MKNLLVTTAMLVVSMVSFQLNAQTTKPGPNNAPKKLFIDVHELQPGKVKATDVAEAHKKDLLVQSKYGVDFIKYWVNEEKGLVYCLSSAADSASVIKTHAEAHGLLPAYTYTVTEGEAAALKDNNSLFLDIHYLGAGKVSAKAVAEAHRKDLAKQDKHGVSFINYWVDERQGVVLCLSQAKNSNAVIETHKEAHGLLPDEVMEVKQGQ